MLKQKFDTKIIVIDHHPISMDLNMLDIRHVNARMAACESGVSAKGRGSSFWCSSWDIQCSGRDVRLASA